MFQWLPTTHLIICSAFTQKIFCDRTGIYVPCSISRSSDGSVDDGNKNRRNVIAHNEEHLDLHWAFATFCILAADSSLLRLCKST